MVGFYIPNLPDLVSPDSIWVNIMRSCEQVVCERRRKNKMLGKKGELATIFDKFSFPSWKQWETAKQSTTGVNVFIFTK